MKKIDLLRGILEAGIWYVFIYYLLYVLENSVELWSAALILLALMYAGIFVCPWIRYTDGWRRMMNKGN